LGSKTAGTVGGKRGHLGRTCNDENAREKSSFYASDFWLNVMKF
jgi:hypothetical protein